MGAEVGPRLFLTFVQQSSLQGSCVICGLRNARRAHEADVVQHHVIGLEGHRHSYAIALLWFGGSKTFLPFKAECGVQSPSYSCH